MSLPVCNFCELEYYPHDTHQCAGNSIIPRNAPDPDEIGEPLLEGPTRADVGDYLDKVRKNERAALNVQAGGDHYRKLAIQPVEYIIANNLSFLAGNIIKYATRYKDKAGAEDIRKIKHYCDLILEFEYKEE